MQSKLREKGNTSVWCKIASAATDGYKVRCCYYSTSLWCVCYSSCQLDESAAGVTGVTFCCKMAHIQYVDELIREYLLYRGFSGTLKAFDSELKVDKDKSFRVRKCVL